MIDPSIRYLLTDLFLLILQIAYLTQLAPSRGTRSQTCPLAKNQRISGRTALSILAREKVGPGFLSKFNAGLSYSVFCLRSETNQRHSFACLFLARRQWAVVLRQVTPSGSMAGTR